MFREIFTETTVDHTSDDVMAWNEKLEKIGEKAFRKSLKSKYTTEEINYIIDISKD